MCGAAGQEKAKKQTYKSSTAAHRMLSNMTSFEVFGSPEHARIRGRHQAGSTLTADVAARSVPGLRALSSQFQKWCTGVGL